MKRLLKILAVILVLNEVRGVINVVVNGPRAIYSAANNDWQGVIDALSSLFFVVVLGVAIWAIAKTLRDYAPAIERTIKEYRANAR